MQVPNRKIVNLSLRIGDVMERAAVNEQTRSIYLMAGAKDMTRFDRIEELCNARLVVLTEGMKMAAAA